VNQGWNISAAVLPQDEPIAKDSDLGKNGNLEIGELHITCEMLSEGAYRALAHIVGKPPLFPIRDDRASEERKQERTANHYPSTAHLARRSESVSGLPGWNQTNAL
jgi:hypothetical protein